jgi:hypothetical protein
MAKQHLNTPQDVANMVAANTQDLFALVTDKPDVLETNHRHHAKIQPSSLTQSDRREATRRITFHLSPQPILQIVNI